MFSYEGLRGNSICKTDKSRTSLAKAGRRKSKNLAGYAKWLSHMVCVCVGACEKKPWSTAVSKIFYSQCAISELCVFSELRQGDCWASEVSLRYTVNKTETQDTPKTQPVNSVRPVKFQFLGFAKGVPSFWCGLHKFIKKKIYCKTQY